MNLPDDLPVIEFASAEAFERWMTQHHETSKGLWVKMARKASGLPTVTLDEALDIVLCHGWIDGQRRSLDETHFLQRYTPRTKRSPWSQRNVEKVASLAKAGRMKPAGLAEVERAKADGRWERAYPRPSDLEVPADLRAELDARPKAAEFFATLNKANRYAIVYQLHSAKRPETRVRRLERFVAMLERGEKLY